MGQWSQKAATMKPKLNQNEANRAALGPTFQIYLAHLHLHVYFCGATRSQNAAKMKPARARARANSNDTT